MTAGEEQADSDRRAEFALNALEQLIKQKTKLKSFGEFTIKLRWRGGVLEHVRVTDETDYK